MNATMDEDAFEISRRKVLGGLGTVGAVSAGAGMGTSAFFSDTEEFENNQLTAGELDLRAGFQSHYSVWSEDEAAANDGSEFLTATFQDDAPGGSSGQDITVGQIGCTGLANDLDRPVVVLNDIKPGDFGITAFELSLCGDPANPGYVWANARPNLSSLAGPNAENGVNEPEGADDDETEAVGTTGTSLSGELGAELRIRPFYVGGGSASFASAFGGLFDSYTDAEAFAMDFFEAFDLSNAPTLDEFTLSVASGLGIPLDGDLSSGSGGFGTSGNAQAVGGDGTVSDFVLVGDSSFGSLDTAATRDCFQAGASYVFGLAWGLDVDHANEIQSDSAAFDLGFYTEQCRHNDGATPGGFGGLESAIQSSTGTGFAKLSEQGNQNAGYGQDGENFNGDGTYATAGHARQKDSQAFELRNDSSSGETVIDGPVNHTWSPDGTTIEHIVYTHDGTNTAEMSVGSDSIGPVTTANPPSTGTSSDRQLAIQVKSDEATVSVGNVQLTVGGSPVSIEGPRSITASDNGSGRDIRYLLLDTSLLDLTTGFRVDADVAINEQGDFNTGSPEAWAFDVLVE
jgi:predicted ribosomally synthesized peptide with SipW-like signal peptide